MSKRLPGSQTCWVITRAPRELMFCVLVGSVMNGWLKLANRTGSIAEIRASDRASRAGIFCFDNAGSDGTMPPAFRDGRFRWNGRSSRPVTGIHPYLVYLEPAPLTSGGTL